MRVFPRGIPEIQLDFDKSIDFLAVLEAIGALEEFIKLHPSPEVVIALTHPSGRPLIHRKPSLIEMQELDAPG